MRYRAGECLHICYWKLYFKHAAARGRSGIRATFQLYTMAMANSRFQPRIVERSSQPCLLTYSSSKCFWYPIFSTAYFCTWCRKTLTFCRCEDLIQKWHLFVALKESVVLIRQWLARLSKSGAFVCKIFSLLRHIWIYLWVICTDADTHHYTIAPPGWCS